MSSVGVLGMIIEGRRERFFRLWGPMISVAVLMAVLLIGAPVSALTGNETTLSFSDLNWISHSDLEFYGLYPNGTWASIGIWNTTSTGLVLAPGVYSVVIHPTGILRLSNPVTFLTDGFMWIQTNAFAIVFILICLGLLFGAAGSRRTKK
jgi:hypothetical protein